MSKESSAKKSEVLDENSGSASHFSFNKGFSKIYKGKYAVGPFLLQICTGRSDQLNFFTRLQHFYYHSHMDIWPQISVIWVSFETAIKMQQTGEGIKLI